MIQEVRTIKFGMPQLEQAIHAYRRMRSGTLPHGRITKTQPNSNATLDVVTEVSQNGAIRLVHSTLQQEQVSEALILYCIENNVVLPRHAAKEVIYADGQAMLLIELDLMVG